MIFKVIVEKWWRGDNEVRVDYYEKLPFMKTYPSGTSRIDQGMTYRWGCNNDQQINTIGKCGIYVKIVERLRLPTNNVQF